MDKSLRIKIAHALRALDSERTELARERDSLQDELSKFAAAKELTFKLWKMGSFPAEDIKEQFEKYLESSKEDLGTLEKAASLMGPSGSSIFGLGKLSNSSQNTGSAEDRFIATLYEF